MANHCRRKALRDHTAFIVTRTVTSKSEPVCRHTGRLALLSGLLPVDAKRAYHLWPRAAAPYVQLTLGKNADRDVYQKQFYVTSGRKPEDRVEKISRGSLYKGWNKRISGFLVNLGSNAVGKFMQSWQRNFISRLVDQRVLSQIRQMRNHYWSGVKKIQVLENKYRAFVDRLIDWRKVNFMKSLQTTFGQRFSIKAPGNTTTLSQAKHEIVETVHKSRKNVIEESRDDLQKIRKFDSGNGNKMHALIKDPLSLSNSYQSSEVKEVERSLSSAPPKSLHWSERLLNYGEDLKTNLLMKIYGSPLANTKNHCQVKVKEPECSPLVSCVRYVEQDPDVKMNPDRVISFLEKGNVCCASIPKKDLNILANQQIKKPLLFLSLQGIDSNIFSRILKQSLDLRERVSFMIYGNCSYKPPRGPFTMKELSESRPNLSSLKYRLSKCPSIEQMWRTAQRKLPAPLIKIEPRKEQLSPVTSTFRTSAFKATGEWLEQTYKVRLRLYKAPGGCLDPVLPQITEVRRGHRFSEGSNLPLAPPAPKPINSAVLKQLQSPCPQTKCPGIKSKC